MSRPQPQPALRAHREAKNQSWRRRMVTWQRSGLSPAAFCRRQGLPYHQFVYWRRRLSPSSGKPKRVAKSADPARSVGFDFVPVHITPPTGRTHAPEWSLELVFASGLEVRWRTQPDADLLLRILAAQPRVEGSGRCG